MSKAICIMGESGAGKTTSMRTLLPGETFYIDCDGKGLSWKGWKNQYNAENKNYYRTDEPKTVLTLMRKIDANQPQIKYLVIDTLNGIMIGDEMRRFKEKGYDKWQDLAQSVYDIVDLSNKMRDDLTAILIAHSQTEDDGNGNLFTRIRTNGKKLNKIYLETKLTTVLLARCKEGRYIFETQSNNSTAKSPMGAFDTFEIDNDIQIVLKALEDF